MKKVRKVHFIGIGGAGMSALAKVLLEMGGRATGSDLKESRNTRWLEEAGATVAIGHRPENLGSPDLVVVSSAIPSNNCEMQLAKEKDIPIMARAEFLAELGKGKTSIAVAGTHGKTTTTSMIALVLEEGGLDPTFLIGGELNDIGANAKYGRGEYFVAEADESDGSFLYLEPNIVVITNVEADHLDYFESYTEIESIFVKFTNLLPRDGQAVVCGDNPGVQGLFARTRKHWIKYGFQPGSDFLATDVKVKPFGTTFNVYSKEKRLGQVSLNIPGIHNVYNALATIALGVTIGLRFSQISRVLSGFTGVRRRFQILGTSKNITLIDDYAHHPTEVRATLEAARQGEQKRLVCVFQPHRFSRTHFLAHQFGSAFRLADLVILTDVYAAGEEPLPGVSGKLLVDAILEDNPYQQVVYLPNKSNIKDFLIKNIKKGDLVLTAGAGDVGVVGEELLSFLKESNS